MKSAGIWALVLVEKSEILESLSDLAKIELERKRSFDFRGYGRTCASAQ